MPDYPRIPYGIADFRRIRLDGELYVDKTRFVRALEDIRYAVLIRPRRIGKSCWISLLEHYYDRRFAGHFDALFAGTDIGRNSTEERSRYVTLRFDFSEFRNAPEVLEASFEEHCAREIRLTTERHPDLFSKEAARAILAPSSVNGKLGELFAHTAAHDIALYCLIDEYDHFANTDLAMHGEEAYHAFTHGSGFYRSFFATLKAGTAKGGLSRLFITGVSPITLDDVTSGFNIGENISLDARFNEMLGLTEAEVREVLERYRALGAFAQDVDEALDVMRHWYDGYRFCEDAETTLYNTDMVLYYLKQSVQLGSMPRRLIDVNVRIDYTKLRHLLVVGRRLNGSFDLLRHLAGEESAEVELQASFPLERLAERDNFLSLLYYFGLLGIRGSRDGATVLGIPNQTVRRLIYGFLRDAYQDLGLFTLDAHRLLPRLRRMATQGEWSPVFVHIAERIEAHTGIRDYIAGEKVLQGFLAAYLSLGEQLVLRSEVECAKGYADLVLEPDVVRFPETRYGYVVELKYLRRAEAVDAARIEALREEAAAQLRRYLGDVRFARRAPAVRFIGVVLIFHGWELVHREAVEVETR